MTIARLTNPAAFDRPEVERLFTRAFEHNPLASFPECKEELRVAAGAEHVAILIGAEEGKLHSLAIACLPLNALTPLPTVYFFYHNKKGSALLRNALVDAVVDFFLQSGYTRFLAINETGRSDEAYGKLFRRAGETQRIGSRLEFKVG